MNEPEQTPTSVPVIEPISPPPTEPADAASPPKKRRDPLVLLFGVGLIVLVGALVFLWQHPLMQMAAAPPVPAAPPPDPRMDALAQRLDGMTQRLAALEQRRPPDPPNLQPIEARIAAVEQRRPPDPPNLQPIEARITALEQRGDPDAPKLDALAARLDADEARMAALAKDTGQISALADRTVRIGRIQAATAALGAGRPVGALPDAPPALARFSTTAPPTEAALRQSFEPTAEAALAARPDTGKLPFWQAVNDRLQSVVTVRRGDQVLIGDGAAGVINRARTALETGDLAACTQALGQLTGPAAAAFADWLASARSLVDARAALQTLAARS